MLEAWVMNWRRTRGSFRVLLNISNSPFYKWKKEYLTILNGILSCIKKKLLVFLLFKTSNPIFYLRLEAARSHDFGNCGLLLFVNQLYYIIFHL